MSSVDLINLIPVKTFADKKRIVLYPAGTGAQYFVEFLGDKYPEMLSKVIGLGDRDVNKVGLLQNGFTVYAPQELPGFEPDLVVVCSGGFKTIIPFLQEQLGSDVALLPYDHIQEYIDYEAQCSTLAGQANETKPDPARLAGLTDWFLSMPLGPAGYTASKKGAYTYRLLKTLQLPEDMTGQRVLDLGGSDGFYSFECLSRGAQRATTVEWHEWTSKQGLARFEAASEFYGFGGEKLHADVESMDYAALGTFDTVLCLGLYYHLHNPISFFGKLAQVTAGTLILSGRAASMPVLNPTAIEAGIKTEQLASYLVKTHHSPKWIANIACLRDLLKLAGFCQVEVLEDLSPKGSLISSVVIRARK